ncbi:MAG: hypothetical protein C0462_12075 [Alcanivorax sp.]|nr:hypothetical protein [Alcanivorax sp.]
MCARLCLLLFFAGLLAGCGSLSPRCWGLDPSTPSADRAVIGCAPTFKRPKGLPYDAWRLGWAHPPWMEMHVEEVRVWDTDGYVNRNGGFGGSRGNFGQAKAEGWIDSRGNPPLGVGWRNQVQKSLPTKIFVRWQSLVEPQTYKVMLEIPEEVRERMLESEHCDVWGGDAIEEYHYNRVIIGLAPGGVATVWLRNLCKPSEMVLRVQADIEERGPYLGEAENHIAPSPEAMEYVEKYGIPYGSW